MNRVYAKPIYTNKIQENCILVNDLYTSLFYRNDYYIILFFFYRGFDIGNHFTEHIHEYDEKFPDGVIATQDNYPSEEEQVFFFYLFRIIPNCGLLFI